MKFLRFILTESLRLIFIVLFTAGSILIALTLTYFNEEYYENALAQKLADFETAEISKKVNDHIGEKYPDLAGSINERDIESLIEAVITKERIASASKEVIRSVKEFNGQELHIDLRFIESGKNEAIALIADFAVRKMLECKASACATHALAPGTLRRDIEKSIQAKISSAIPQQLDIPILTPEISKVIYAIRFTIINSGKILLATITMLLIPLMGIFGLNFNPLSRGLKIVGTTAVISGISIISTKYAFAKSLDLLNEASNKSPTQVNYIDYERFFSLVFSDVYHIMMVMGGGAIIAGAIAYLCAYLIARNERTR